MRYRSAVRAFRCLRAITPFVFASLVLAACSTGSGVESSASPSPTVVESAAPVETVSDTSQSASSTSATAAQTIAPTTSTTERLMTAQECAAEVELELRLGQLLFPVVTQADLPAATVLAERGLIAGVVIIGEPTETITADIASLQSRTLVAPSFIAVDEEGGRVQRVAGLAGSIPSARDVATSLSLAEAETLAHDHAIRLGELGFTMNLAPVVDLDNGDFIRDRSFGEDPDTVTDYAFATANGIASGGLIPVVKHFPGHGRGTDSHTGLPTLPGLDTLRGSDLVPFVRSIERGDLPIMVGHLVVPGLTDGQPATLSPAAVDGLLRTELGFDGLVMTDALNMDAIADTNDPAVAAELALAAGVDLVMLGQIADVEGTIVRLTDAVRAGRISEASVTESFVRSISEREIDLCSLPEALLPAIGCRSGAGGCAAN